MANFDSIRFIGYAVPTTPADMVDVGDPNGSGSVAGTYRALEDQTADIKARVGQLKVAVKAAEESLASEPQDGVLNVFLVPEFYWHGHVGPYTYSSEDDDPADLILSELNAAFPAEQYPNYLFVFGSVISALIDNVSNVFEDPSAKIRNDIVRALGEGWRASSGPMSNIIFDAMVNFIQNSHAYPLVEVRNRALILSGVQVQSVLADEWKPLEAQQLTVEKSYDSNEDFLLWDVTGKPVITEQMTAYPVIDTSGGELKSDAHDSQLVFGLSRGDDVLRVGVEVCLDHSDQRLRRSLDRNNWPSAASGIQLHLVPSCGMQLHPASVAAIAEGWAFNCDGQYGLSADGAPAEGVVAGVASSHASFIDDAQPAYAAHTQLSRVVQGAELGNSKAPGASDATFAEPGVLPLVVPVGASAEFAALFSAGSGELHIYGHDKPLPLA